MKEKEDTKGCKEDSCPVNFTYDVHYHLARRDPPRLAKESWIDSFCSNRPYEILPPIVERDYYARLRSAIMSFSISVPVASASLPVGAPRYRLCKRKEDCLTDLFACRNPDHGHAIIPLRISQVQYSTRNTPMCKLDVQLLSANPKGDSAKAWFPSKKYSDTMLVYSKTAAGRGGKQAEPTSVTSRYGVTLDPDTQMLPGRHKSIPLYLADVNERYLDTFSTIYTPGKLMESVAKVEDGTPEMGFLKVPDDKFNVAPDPLSQYVCNELRKGNHGTNRAQFEDYTKMHNGERFFCMPYTEFENYAADLVKEREASNHSLNLAAGLTMDFTPLDLEAWNAGLQHMAETAPATVMYVSLQLKMEYVVVGHADPAADEEAELVDADV